jgi:adenosylcobinamide kinase/adenosylcobinamide-phosphate guanylyltransferase
MTRQLVLILGGARSGKSRFAQETASRLGERVLFVATAEALDEEMRRRIEEHKRARPSAWRTLEAPYDVGRRICDEAGSAQVVIVDCLTLLVSNLIGRCGGDSEHIDADLFGERLKHEIRELVDSINSVQASFIVVSNEVGMGLVPDSSLGRLYRDHLGKANQDLAQRADLVYFMVAGMPMVVKGATEGH